MVDIKSTASSAASSAAGKVSETVSNVMSSDNASSSAKSSSSKDVSPEFKNSQTNAILKIDGFKPRKILEYSYSFAQAIDLENQPSGIPRGGKLSVKVEAYTKEVNDELFGWMVSKTQKKEGKIILKTPTDYAKDLKTIEFTDAFCVDYKETWKDQKAGGTEVANTEDIQITWRTLKWGKVSYENEWQ
jgi:hypothetical protein